MEFKKIDINYLITNKSNPRGEYLPDKDPTFGKLIESVGQFGILVPIIAKKKDESHYLIVDGDRRYNAAKKVRIKEVPVYIIDDDIDNTENYIRTMYQIHMNRKDWDAATQQKYSEYLQKQIELNYEDQILNKNISNSSTNKFEVNINIQNNKVYQNYNDEIKKNEIKRNFTAKKLAEITGMQTNKAKDNIIFSEWPILIKKDIWNKHRDIYSYIITIEQSFIQPLLNNYLGYVYDKQLNNIRELLYKKIKANTISRAADIRKLKVLFKNIKYEKKDLSKIYKIFDYFIDNIDIDIKQTCSEYLNCFPEDIETVGKSVNDLTLDINHLIKVLKDYNFNNLGNQDKEKINNKLNELKLFLNHIINH